MEENTSNCRVQVVVRCRPLNKKEKEEGGGGVIACDQERRCVKVHYSPSGTAHGGKKVTKNFTYDQVFGQYTRQEELFKACIQPIIHEVFKGFNCTVFAYGLTGTGKTYTMEGDLNDPKEYGVIPRAVNKIFQHLEKANDDYNIRVSFLELYNEVLPLRIFRHLDPHLTTGAPRSFTT